MQQRITQIDGHPDEDPARLTHALVEAYMAGARTAGHQVRRVNVAELEFSLIGSLHDWRGTYVPSDIRHAQEAIAWASHLVLFYPLWLGDMPALLKGFLEQVMRPGFAIDDAAGPDQAGRLHGRSARLVVTLGMPVHIHRLHFGGHSLLSLGYNILSFAGIEPIDYSVYDNIEDGPKQRAEWLSEMRTLGEQGS